MNSQLKNNLYSETEILEYFKKLKEQKLFAVYKPKNWTSQDTVSFLKSFLSAKKVGHAGTLDPLASGLLIVGIDEETKNLASFLNSYKTYVTEIELNKKSTTGDMEGVIEVVGNKQYSLQEIQVQINHFNDLTYNQYPHKYSAVKIAGKKAYEYARDNQVIEMQPRKVHIKSIKLLNFENNILKVELNVSKGFYVRSFAEDFGEKLKTSGYLLSLLRTGCDKFVLDENTLNIQKLKKSLKKVNK